MHDQDGRNRSWSLANEGLPGTAWESANVGFAGYHKLARRDAICAEPD